MYVYIYINMKKADIYKHGLWFTRKVVETHIFLFKCLLLQRHAGNVFYNFCYITHKIILYILNNGLKNQWSMRKKKFFFNCSCFIIILIPTPKIQNVFFQFFFYFPFTLNIKEYNFFLHIHMYVYVYAHTQCIP